MASGPSATSAIVRATQSSWPVREVITSNQMSQASSVAADAAAPCVQADRRSAPTAVISSVAASARSNPAQATSQLSAVVRDGSEV
jgi:hypothetical protein